MECNAIRDELSEFLDGRLTDARRREIAAHLDSCGDCRQEIEDLQKVIDLVGELPYMTAPSGLHDRILEQTLNYKPGADRPLAMPPRYLKWLPLMKGLGAAAVLVCFMVVGLQFMQRSDRVPVAAEFERGLDSKLGETKAGLLEGEDKGAEKALTLKEGKQQLGRYLEEAAKEKSDAGPTEQIEAEAKPEARPRKAEGGEAEGAVQDVLKENKAGRSGPEKSEHEDAEEQEREAPAERKPSYGKAGGGRDALKDADAKKKEKARADSPRDKGDGSRAERGRKSEPPPPAQRKAGELDERLKKLKGKAGEIPSTLVITSGDPGKNALKIRRVLSVLQSKEVVRRGIRSKEPVRGPAQGEVRKGEPAPSDDGLEDEEGGAEGGAPRPSGGPAPQAPGEPEASEKQLEAVSKKKGEAPGGAVDEVESEKKGPAGFAANLGKIHGRVEDMTFHLTEEEYKLFKTRIADAEVGFREEPSNLLRALYRKRASEGQDKDAKAPGAWDAPEGDNRAPDADTGAAGKRRSAGKILIRVTIRFLKPSTEAHPEPAPAPKPGRAEEKDEESDK